MSKNKFGSYIQQLMAVIVDREEEDDFVKELAFSELRRLNVDMSEFLLKHNEDDKEEKEHTEKQLLLEFEENKNDKNR